MATPESKVKNKVKKLLKEYEMHGLYQHWPVQHGYGSPTLDCIGAFKGRPFAIECKRPGESMNRRQAVTGGNMDAAGITVFLVDGYTEVKMIGDPAYVHVGMKELETWLAGLLLL